MNFGLVRLFCARIGTPLWLVYGASHEEESIDSNMVVFPFHQTFTSKLLSLHSLHYVSFIDGLRFDTPKQNLGNFSISLKKLLRFIIYLFFSFSLAIFHSLLIEISKTKSTGEIAMYRNEEPQISSWMLGGINCVVLIG